MKIYWNWLLKKNKKICEFIKKSNKLGSYLIILISLFILVLVTKQQFYILQEKNIFEIRKLIQSRGLDIEVLIVQDLIIKTWNTLVINGTVF